MQLAAGSHASCHKKRRDWMLLSLLMHDGRAGGRLGAAPAETQRDILVTVQEEVAQQLP